MIRRSLPFDAWPEADRIAWTEAIAEGDIFEGRGPAARWAPTTRYTVRAAYGRYLSFLAASEPLVLAEPPVDRLTDDRLGRYLGHLAETAGTMGRHMYFAKLRDAARAMFSGNVPQHLSRRVARLENECRPQSKAARIVTSTRLAALGTKLMEAAIAVEGEIKDPVDYRDGLMIALLAQRPVRLRTLALIRIGTHLRQVGEEWRMVFEDPESKSGRAFEITVPEKLVPPLEYYLQAVRPSFTGADRHDGIWASTKGRPLTRNAIARIITERNREAFGQPVNPHLFRHCAATTIAILQPGRIGVARDLLGHASLATTNAYYNQARSIEASRLYAGVLTGLSLSSRRRSKAR
jgi:integrase/recombinase XerD